MKNGVDPRRPEAQGSGGVWISSNFSKARKKFDLKTECSNNRLIRSCLSWYHGLSFFSLGRIVSSPSEAYFFIFQLQSSPHKHEPVKKYLLPVMSQLLLSLNLI